MKSIVPLTVFDICLVLLWSTLFARVDAGISTSCKDEFYDSNTERYRSCKECVPSIEEHCAVVCCKTSVTVEPAGNDRKSDNKEEKSISEKKEMAETDGIRPSVAVVILLGFFALLLLLVLLLVLVKSMRDRASENRARCEGFAGIQEVLGGDSVQQDTSVAQEDTSVCSCQVKVTTHPDMALGSQTSLAKQNSPV